MKPFLAGLALGIAFAFAPVHGATSLVTGYTLRGTTASGTYTHPGTAACPPTLRFGTELAIAGVGVVRCEDAYARWLSPRVDVWTATMRQAYALTGWRDVEVVAAWPVFLR